MEPVGRQQRLYVSDYDGYKDLQDELDVVVNLSFRCDSSYTRDQSYIHLPIRDDERANYRDFQQACCAVLHRYRNFDERILIHCASGQSRSVSVAAAILAVAEDVPLPKMLENIKAEDVELHPMLKKYAKKFLKAKNNR